MRAPSRRTLAFFAAVTLLSCGEWGLGPVDVLSIEFDSLPFPAVVLGDELRGTEGEPVPLEARVFRGEEEIADAEVRFLALDTGFVEITDDGRVLGRRLSTGPVRIIASYEGLQSAPLQLFVTPAPTSVAATVPTTDTLEYLTTQQPLSDPLAVRVSAAADAAVRGWTVRYDIVEPSASEAVPGALVNDAGRLSATDTTDAAGAASRRFRLDPSRITNPTGQDTILVDAEVRYRGSPVAGSPVRFVLLVRPRVAS